MASELSSSSIWDPFVAWVSSLNAPPGSSSTTRVPSRASELPSSSSAGVEEAWEALRSGPRETLLRVLTRIEATHPRVQISKSWGSWGEKEKEGFLRPLNLHPEYASHFENGTRELVQNFVDECRKQAMLRRNQIGLVELSEEDRRTLSAAGFVSYAFVIESVGASSNKGTLRLLGFVVEHKQAVGLLSTRRAFIAQNFGASIPRSALLLGASGKGSDSSSAGVFGEGMKVQICRLLKDGARVRFFTGGERWEFSHRTDKMLDTVSCFVEGSVVEEGRFPFASSDTTVFVWAETRRDPLLDLGTFLDLDGVYSSKDRDGGPQHRSESPGTHSGAGRMEGIDAFVDTVRIHLPDGLNSFEVLNSAEHAGRIFIHGIEACKSKKDGPRLLKFGFNYKGCKSTFSRISFGRDRDSLDVPVMIADSLFGAALDRFSTQSAVSSNPEHMLDVLRLVLDCLENPQPGCAVSVVTTQYSHWPSVVRAARLTLRLWIARRDLKAQRAAKLMDSEALKELQKDPFASNNIFLPSHVIPIGANEESAQVQAELLGVETEVVSSELLKFWRSTNVLPWKLSKLLVSVSERKREEFRALPEGLDKDGKEGALRPSAWKFLQRFASIFGLDGVVPEAAAFRDLSSLREMSRGGQQKGRSGPTDGRVVRKRAGVGVCRDCPTVMIALPPAKGPGSGGATLFGDSRSARTTKSRKCPFDHVDAPFLLIVNSEYVQSPALVHERLRTLNAMDAQCAQSNAKNTKQQKSEDRCVQPGNCLLTLLVLSFQELMKDSTAIPRSMIQKMADQLMARLLRQIPPVLNAEDPVGEGRSSSSSNSNTEDSTDTKDTEKERQEDSLTPDKEGGNACKQKKQAEEKQTGKEGGSLQDQTKKPDVPRKPRDPEPVPPLPVAPSDDPHSPDLIPARTPPIFHTDKTILPPPPAPPSSPVALEKLIKRASLPPCQEKFFDWSLPDERQRQENTCCGPQARLVRSDVSLDKDAKTFLYVADGQPLLSFEKESARRFYEHIERLRVALGLDGSGSGCVCFSFFFERREGSLIRGFNSQSRGRRGGSGIWLNAFKWDCLRGPASSRLRGRGTGERIGGVSELDYEWMKTITHELSHNEHRNHDTHFADTMADLAVHFAKKLFPPQLQPHDAPHFSEGGRNTQAAVGGQGRSSVPTTHVPASARPNVQQKRQPRGRGLAHLLLGRRTDAA